MSRPPMRTWPLTRTPSIRSFMRLNTRSSVLLPQPLGPIRAVTCAGGYAQVDAGQGLEVAVKKIEGPGFDADLAHVSQTCR